MKMRTLWFLAAVLMGALLFSGCSQKETQEEVAAEKEAAEKAATEKVAAAEKAAMEEVAAAEKAATEKVAAAEKAATEKVAAAEKAAAEANLAAKKLEEEKQRAEVEKLAAEKLVAEEAAAAAAAQEEKERTIEAARERLKRAEDRLLSEKKPVPEAVSKVLLRGDEPARGASDPLVTAVVFCSLTCPFCKKMGPVLDQLVETYRDDVRIVWKYGQLMSYHKNPRGLALAACAAHQQGRFWEMRTNLFEELVFGLPKKALTKTDIEGYAQELGLDIERFWSDRDSVRCAQVVDKDQKLSKDIGALGTPNTFVNGRKWPGGVMAYESLEALVEAEIAKAEILVANGARRDEVYRSTIEGGKRQ